MARQEEQTETFTIRKATRRATPQLMAIWGPTFSGKTYSALLVAAGMVLPGQKIGMIDSENGRGSAFGDDELLMRVMPQGYDVIEIDPPFHPRRYISAIHQFEQAGYSLIVTDSASHAWAGEGGGLDMKEQDKGWANSKLWQKRLLSAYLYSPCHHIVCLRAQDKVKIVGRGRDQEYIQLGVLPICERNFPFDLGLCFSVEGEIDGKPATHLAQARKWPKVMNPLFDNWKPQLLSPEVGVKIREWNERGAESLPLDRLVKQAKATAEEGMQSYKAFFESLTPAQRKSVTPQHSANKAIAEAADREAASAEPDEVDTLPDPVEQVEGKKVRCKGQTWEARHGDIGSQWIAVQER